MFRSDEHGVLQVSAWEQYPWLLHGFSTRLTGDFLRWPTDREIAVVFGAPGAGTAMLRQKHSNHVVFAHHAWGGDRPEGDAVLTDRPGVLVGVRTADCLPVLLMDPARRAVAAVHAGWRGVAGGILCNALQGMARAYGSRPSSIEAAVGPGIGVCCFEVGDEVAAQFEGEYVDRRRIRPRVDLLAALRAQLIAAGVDRVAACSECTSCDLGRYYSHRAERGRTGRMLAVVGVRPGDRT